MRNHLSPRRRGSVLVAVILAMLVLASFAAAFGHQTATHTQGSVPYWQVLMAQYAAESGLEMAMQELSSSTDVDGNGTLGSIAERQIGDLSNVTVSVAVADEGSAKVLTATGKAADTQRVIEIRIQ